MLREESFRLTAIAAPVRGIDKQLHTIILLG
jgi:hypothetical protein